MAGFNFKKEARVYIVYGGNQYEICVSEINFSQTFTEESYEVKTLHDQSLMFEGSVINKANKANFDFSLPIIKEPDLQILFDLAIDYDTSSPSYRKLLKTFDLYIATKQDIFKLEYCAISSCAFEVDKKKPLGLTISGDASKMTKVGEYGIYTIPGIVIPLSVTQTYIIPTKIYATVDSVDITKSIYKFTIQLQNNISWIGYETVNQAILATDASNSMYPTQFTLNNRILAGSIGMYIDGDDYSNFQNWSTNVPIRVQVGDDVGGIVYGFDFNMGACSFTNRLTADSAFTQHYDFRMIQNPAALSDVITYVTY